jgi:rhamnogalacturonan endolyase
MLAILLYQAIAVSAQTTRQDRVVLAQDQYGYTLSNSLVQARIDKSSGDLISLRYHGMEMLTNSSGHPGAYWSHSAAGPRVIDAITIDPKSNDGKRAEVSIKGISGGHRMGQGPGGSTICDIEIRYALDNQSSGVYTYCIFSHPASYPYTAIGEARFAAKLNNDIFDWMTIDARRNKKMISAADWQRGQTLNMKEARRITTGIDAGEVEHKYDYSAVQFDIPAFGWSSTQKHIGLWFVNPSMEYLSGGATKLELTSHRDINPGAAPVLLNYWRGSHYGGSICVIASGENWDKVIGPFLIYCNSGDSPEGIWKDALAQASAQAKQWPYEWVNGVDYPHVNQRATVVGKFALSDPEAKSPVHLMVGLAHPDYASWDWRSQRINVDWQLDAKNYEFWVRGDASGKFRIPAVRPGTYTLHAIADNVLGEFALANIQVKAGQTLDLGTLNWQPVRYGRQLWEIGIPDRTAGEFFHGNHYWQWGLYNEYAKDFPHDVHFVIGQSDWHKDWNIMQVPRASDQSGRGWGDGTTWSVEFALPEAPTGRATLRVGLAGTEARRINVGINGKQAGVIDHLLNTTVIHRDADRGYWQERDVSFDASMMKQGKNVLTLSIPAGPVTAGIEYDYLRLELADSVAMKN